MEVLVKLPTAHDGIIKADKGYVKLGVAPGSRWRAALRVDRIYGIYAGPDGLYAAYSVRDVSELVRLADVVAQRPPELRPITAKIKNFVYAICDGEKFDDVVDDDCEPIYESLEVPQREPPADLITREILWDVLLRRLDLKTALYYDALKYVAQTVLRLVPLCDESGKIAIGNYDYVYYCRIEDRIFVKRLLSEPFYEVPSEWVSGLEVKERATHPGVEELRRTFGLEVDARQLIDYVAQKLGLAEEQRYVHTAKYCIAPSIELPRDRQLVAEPYGGIVRVFRAYRLYYGDGDCTDVPSPYGVYVVICTTVQQHECEAWRVGDIGPEEPSKVIADCIEDCECSHTLLGQMPSEKKEEVLKILEERLRDKLERSRNFEHVKCFPLEVFSRVIGPVASYEDAESKWKQAMEEVERRKEEERRRLEEEMRRRREEILAKLKDLPVKIEDKGDLIRVSLAKRLPEDEFRRVVERLKRLGFKFDKVKKMWYIIL